MNFKQFFIAGIALLGLTFGSAQAAQYSPGNGYNLIQPAVPVMADGKIHVEEAFWYGCPHCFDLGKITAPWSKKLAEDVAFTSVPAQFGRPWVSHAQFYYTAEVLGVLDDVHTKIFNSVHVQKKHLLSERDQRDFLIKNAGISAEDFNKAYKSFTVRSRMKTANQRIESFGIQGVPAIIVQGKYVVDANSANGQHNILKVVDYLIEQERRALRK